MISIRPYQDGDALALHAAVLESVAELQPWMPWCHPQFSVADAEGWVTRQLVAFREAAEFEFVICDEDGSVLGGCGLNRLDADNLRANLGYWVRTSATGRGVATAAVQQLVAWAAGQTALVRLEVVIAVENRASIRVAEKADAIREGISRSRLILHELVHDADLWVFIRGANLK